LRIPRKRRDCKNNIIGTYKLSAPPMFLEGRLFMKFS